VSERLILEAPRIVTCDAARTTDDDPLGVIERGRIVVDDGRVTAIGTAETIDDEDVRVLRHDGVVTPGLVDAHTHAVWIGSRGQEYAMRMAGADYEAIAAAGGGIVASMRAVREASLEELRDVLTARLTRMAAMGVTCVEVKSGYGLDEASERRQLEAVRAVAELAELPAVQATFLGLHAVPPEAEGDKDAHARRCKTWLEGIAADGLARWVDAYIDRNAFSVDQARPLLERARELGLGVRLHVGQFADVGGAQLAAELGAASVDHVEHVDEDGMRALAEAGVRAVLLPVASFTLGQAPPPVEALQRAGVELVVASDANPGTAPTESLPLAMAMGVRTYGLSASEALLGATRHAADSLDHEGGRIVVGGPADLALWDLPHEHDLMQPWGVSRVRATIRGGVVIAGSL
jgi:imidazolonepropionase